MPCRADIATMAVLEEPLGASWVFQGVKEAFWVLKISRRVRDGPADVTEVQGDE